MRAIFAYIPVVHQGTLSFLAQYSDASVFLLDNEAGKKENPYLERDLRALPAAAVAAELRVHGIEARVLKGEEIASALAPFAEVIVPEDEIVDLFMEKYAPQLPVRKVNTFLRWTKLISTVENEVPPDRKVSHAEFAKETMAALEQEAQRSPDWWRQIGAAIVRGGETISIAHNMHLPSAHALEINGDPRSNLDAGQGPGIYTSIHAEACALARAAKEGKATDGADVYVTTFPCPTCARSLVEAGIARVFYKKGYSLLDAEEILRGAGVEIILVAD
jgi:dCMP deaminase